MRIDSIFPQSGPSQTNSPSREPVIFQKGETVFATVVGQEGNTVKLLTQNGRPFTAQLAADASLLPYDRVECLVSGELEGQMQLQLLEVTRESGSVPGGRLPPQEAAILETAGLFENPMAREVLTALRSTDIRPSSALVQQAVALMESHGLDAQSALFFLANEIPATQDNLQVFRQMEGGALLGPQLHAFLMELLAGETADPLAALAQFMLQPEGTEQAFSPSVGTTLSPEVGMMAQNVDLSEGVMLLPTENGFQPIGEAAVLPGEGTAVSGNPPPRGNGGAVLENLPVATLPVDLPVEIPIDATGLPTPPMAASTGEGTQVTPLLPQEDGISLPSSQLASTGQEVVLSDSAAETAPPPSREVVLPADRPDVQGRALESSPQAPEIPLPEGGQGQGGVAVSGASFLPLPDPLPATPMELAQHLLSMFLRLDRRVDGGRVKQVVDNTGQLEQLKEVLEGNTTARGGLLPRMEEMAAQTKFTQDINRFVMVQIPVQNPNPDTAELYVFKQKRQDKGVDPEDTAILIALNTQQLGRVETMIRVERKNLSLDFKIEEEEGVSLFREEVAGLYGAMDRLGYHLTDARVSPLFRRTTLKNAQETLLRTVERPRVYVDYRI